jgi:hypothetical protein
MAKFKGIEKNCEVCGKLFRCPQSRRNPRTCSNECGYKIRAKSNSGEWVDLKCACCGEEFKERSCHAGRRRFCSYECQHKDAVFKAEKSASRTGELNAGWKGGIAVKAVSKTGRSYLRLSSAKENAKVASRRRLVLLATPKWAKCDSILAFYEEAQVVSAATGVVHHVDHIVPLTSKYVCGLHCEANLRVLPGAENISKSNRKWPDMP